MMKKSISCALAAIVTIPLTTILADMAMAADDEAPKEIIASQIKRQGYACDHPKEAKRDTAFSKPDSAVWLLECESGTYRVRLVPDMGAQVERID